MLVPPPPPLVVGDVFFGVLAVRVRSSHAAPLLIPNLSTARSSFEALALLLSRGSCLYRLVGIAWCVVKSEVRVESSLGSTPGKSILITGSSMCSSFVSRQRTRDNSPANGIKKVPFGEVRGRNDALANSFQVSSYPRLLFFCGGDASVSFFYEVSEASVMEKY